MRARDLAGAALFSLLAMLACKGKKPFGGSSASDCGMRPDDWCKSVAGDPCASHTDDRSCRADARCEGYPYAGESAVACMTDDRCFADNCPTVGCISRCEELDQASCMRKEPCFWRGQGGTCKASDHRCRWDGARCVRTAPCRGGFPAPPSSKP